LLTGIGGGRLLTAEIDKRLSQKETKALIETRDALAGAVKELVEPKE